MILYKNTKLIVLSILLIFICNCNKTATNRNDDILTLLIEKPVQLEFIKSTHGKGQQVLEAIYRVSGANANLIETLLHKNYGMGRLRFACCGWESHPDGKLKITKKFNNKYKSLFNYNYISISMHSDETLIKDRNKWKKIPYFYIAVKVLNI